MKKKIRTNAVIIAISIIACIIGVVLAIIFDLYSYIGTVGGIIVNACILFGVFGALEIDDWTIWYKRLLIKKFNNTKGKLDMKVYHYDLSKKYLWFDAEIDGYSTNNNQGVIFTLKLIDKSGLSIELPCTINYITGGITICDEACNAYKVGKLQYASSIRYSSDYGRNKTTLEEKVYDFNMWLRRISEWSYNSFNPDSLVYTIEK